MESDSNGSDVASDVSGGNPEANSGPSQTGGNTGQSDSSKGKSFSEGFTEGVVSYGKDLISDYGRNAARGAGYALGGPLGMVFGDAMYSGVSKAKNLAKGEFSKDSFSQEGGERKISVSHDEAKSLSDVELQTYAEKGVLSDQIANEIIAQRILRRK
jgi:hypothetical protein